MKKTIRLIEAMRSIAIIALLTIIGFSMAGCASTGSTSGVPSPFEGTWQDGPYDPDGPNYNYIRFEFTATTYKVFGDVDGIDEELMQGGRYTFTETDYGYKAAFRGGGLAGNVADMQGDIITVQGFAGLRLRSPNDDEIRIITIDNVSLTGDVGVFIMSNLASGNNPPTTTAIQYGTISNNKINFSLVVPKDNTWSIGPLWLGSGDYYVYIIPIANGSAQPNNALVYTGDGSTPAKVTFNKAVTELSFGSFRRAF